jgi:hypothetical protein
MADEEVNPSPEYPVDDYVASLYGRPISWVLVAQYLDENGDREVVVDVSGETHLWEIQGLLNYAMNDANAQQADFYMTSVIGDEDDE